MMYIGIKKVNAEPMTAEVANEKGYKTGGNTGYGYEVTYDDGYKSWCPKDVFDCHNFELRNERLADTCKMMVSPDYKERFKAEYIQLANRYQALKKMVELWDAGRLDFTPTCERTLYDQQLMAMSLYLDVLNIRAEKEGVDLYGYKIDSIK